MFEQSLTDECAALLENAATLAADAALVAEGEIGIARRFTEVLFDQYSGPKAQDVEREIITLGPAGNQFEIRHYRKSSAAKMSNRPMVLFFHGGGWSVGDANCYEPFIMALCSSSGADFLSVDFRQAPEHAYPVAHNDCYLATKWAFESAADLNVDSNRIALMGDSAGAGIATAIALRLAREKYQTPEALYLLYPFLDARNEHALYPSRMRFGDGEYLISRDGLELASLWYAGTKDAQGCPELSPVADGDLSELPQTIIVTASCDPLFDEGRLFADKAIAAGVKVRAKEVTGAIHGFLPFGALKVAQEVRDWLAKDVQDRLAMEA